MSDDKPLTIRFTVPAVPVAQPRQRSTTIAGHIHNYTPSNHPVQAYKATVRLAAMQATGGIFDCPITLSAVFIMPRPKKLVWKSRPMPRIPHTGTPDLGNLLKSTEDALNGLTWRDDSLVFRYGLCEKWIAAGNEQPHVEVTVEAHP